MSSGCKHCAGRYPFTSHEIVTSPFGTFKITQCTGCGAFQESDTETEKALGEAQRLRIELRDAREWARKEHERASAAEAELQGIRAERERAQARLLGHPAYGEGAVCDGPGTPHTCDLRELTDAVGKLVAKLSPTLAAIGVSRTCVYCGEESRATLLQMRSEGSHVCVCPRCFKEETAKAG